MPICEQLVIYRSRLFRLRDLQHAFAQRIQRYRDAFGVQFGSSFDGFIHRHASHKPPRHATANYRPFRKRTECLVCRKPDKECT